MVVTGSTTAQYLLQPLRSPPRWDQPVIPITINSFIAEQFLGAVLQLVQLPA